MKQTNEPIDIVERVLVTVALALVVASVLALPLGMYQHYFGL